MMKPIIAVTLSFFSLACTSTASLERAACKTTDECNAGLVCSDGHCASPCLNGGAQCSAAGQTLVVAPSISSVSGDSARGTIIAGVRIAGANLDTVRTLRLLDQASKIVGNLIIGTAEASELNATIPAELAAAIAASTTGQFILEAESAGGAARQNVTILKGDAGPAGPQGAQGLQGAQGAPGLQGPAGANGVITLPYSGTSAQADAVFKVSNSGVGAAIVAANSAPYGSGVALKVEGNTDLKFNSSGVRLPLFVMSKAGYFSFCTSDGAPFDGITNIKIGTPISCGCSCINGSDNGAVSMLKADGTNPGDGYTELDFGAGCYCNSGGACPVQKTYATCIRSF